MRRFWAAAVILVFLLAGTLVNAGAARRFAGGLTDQLERAQELAAQGDWEGAEAISQEVYQRWRDREFYLHVFMRHSDTDQILRSFRALEQYLALEEADQYTAANADLITQLELLAEMEQPSWMNIL